jgi:TonB family protein
MSANLPTLRIGDSPSIRRKVTVMRSGFSLCLCLAFTITTLSLGGTTENSVLRPGLEKHLRRIAGKDPIVCGNASTIQESMAITNCVIDSFRARHGFYVIYSLQGIDSIPGRSLVGDADGRLFEISFDFGLPLEAKPRKHIETKRCSEPVELVMTRTGQLTCANGRFTYDQGICGPVPLRTPTSRLAGQTGSIAAEVVVDREGGASPSKVLKSDFSTKLTDDAMDEIRQWSFSPAMKNGHAVSVKINLTLAGDGRSEIPELHEDPAMTGCFASSVRITR